jgi:hypothetical protein
MVDNSGKIAFNDNSMEAATCSTLIGNLGVAYGRPAEYSGHPKNFRYALVILAIASAVLTPSGDIGPMIAFLTGMIGLYFLSILFAMVFGKNGRTA